MRVFNKAKLRLRLHVCSKAFNILIDDHSMETPRKYRLRDKPILILTCTPIKTLDFARQLATDGNYNIIIALVLFLYVR